MPQKKKGLPVKEVAVSLVRRYQLSEKVCPVCGQKFMGTKKAKYDRLACRQKANYERHADVYRQSQLEKYHAEREAAAGKK
jgi:tRNA(Ile2) C34 agmatinyltransferase TiaS